MQKQTWSQRIIRKSATLIGLPIRQELLTTSFQRNKWLPSNEIHTSKYTWWSFLPKNLFQQFSKLPNLYFLIIGIFQILPFSSSTQGVPTIYLPLGVILLVTAIKDLYEDRQRTLSDYSDNHQQVTEVTKQKQEKVVVSSVIHVGDVIKVNKNQTVPADGLVIASSLGELAYVETPNIDGETALKKKIIAPVLLEQFDKTSSVIPQITVEYEPPNSNMNKFVGRLVHNDHKIPLNNNNLLLRSSRLKNTEFVYLLVLYTGHQSKIVLSMNKPSQKKSVLEQKLGYYIFGVFLFMIGLSFVASGLNLHMRIASKHSTTYQSPAATFFIGVLAWILNLGNLVPISLIVTVEAVKLLQSKLLVLDPKMKTGQFNTIVNCSSILQDMGVIQCVASDKTGTLTKNKLTLRMISDGLLTYKSDTNALSTKLLSMLCTAHQVSLSHDGEFEGVSQDEIAVLQFCKQKGVLFKGRKGSSIEVEIADRVVVKEVLKIIEFTSQRKKQTTIYEEDGVVYVVVKGADEEMLKIIMQSQIKKTLEIDINDFAKSGLRTLVYGFKKIPKAQCNEWLNKYKRAESDRNVIDISLLLEKLQSGLQVLCATGIEDQLQDSVVDTVKSLISANIKFLIISGDKPETVMAIANNLCLNQKPFLANSYQYKEEYSQRQLVVFARCTPKDKQKIVQSIPGKILAIGDGANDVCMLTKAAIGVGINGKEGKAAVQAADVGVPEFKYLKRLLFYYGCELCRKNATLVKYNFYKNFVYALPQLVFGVFSRFTGCYIYENTLSQLFNLLYSTLPIIIFALFDQQSQEQDLLTNKYRTYELSRKGTYFSKLSLFATMAQATLQTTLSSYLIYYLLPKMFRSPQDLDMFLSSTFIFTYVVITVNLVLLNRVKFLSAGYFLSIFITLAAFFISLKVIETATLQIKQIYAKMLTLRATALMLMVLTYTMSIHYIFRLFELLATKKTLIAPQVFHDSEVSLKNQRQERVLS